VSMLLKGAGVPPDGILNPASLAGHAFTLEADPAYCFKDAAGTSPCVVGNDVYCWKDTTGTLLFVNAAAPTTKRQFSQDAGGKYYVHFGGGAQDYLALANAPASLDGADAATVALACNPANQTQTLYTALAIGDGSGNGNFVILRGDGNTPPNWQSVVSGNATNTTATDPSDYVPGSDVRVVSFAETTTLDTHKLYIDGAEVASAARTAALPVTVAGGINIATDTFDTSRKYIGHIHGLTVWTEDHRDRIADIDAYLQSLMP
jgi:hypothetical protein